jgi:arylsulfatase A-like enzyme
MFSRVHFGFQTTDAPPAMSLEVVAERESLQRLPLALGMLTGEIGERLFPITRFLTNNADPEMLTERITDQLHRLEDTGKPFFLAAFYSVTHLPFATPMPEGARFTNRDYQGRSRYAYEIQQINEIARLGERPSDAEVEQVRGLYDGAVASFDEAVGKIVAQLDADGVKDRIIIIAGDHGENLFEPGATTEHGKWFAGGEAAYRTTMLLQGTGIPQGDIKGLRSGVDFAPTILRLLHLPQPAMDGESLLEPASADRTIFAETTTWLGGAADRPPHTILYPPIVDLLESEQDSHALVLRRRFADVAVTAKLREARQGAWQLIYTPTPDGMDLQLHNLDNDPFGQTDVASAHPDIAATLERKLLGWMALDPIRWLDGKRHLVARRER